MQSSTLQPRSAIQAAEPYQSNGTDPASHTERLRRRVEELERELSFVEGWFTLPEHRRREKVELLDSQLEAATEALERAREIEFRKLWDGDASERAEEAADLAARAYAWVAEEQAAQEETLWAEVGR